MAEYFKNLSPTLRLETAIFNYRSLIKSESTQEPATSEEYEQLLLEHIEELKTAHHLSDEAATHIISTAHLRMQEVLLITKFAQFAKDVGMEHSHNSYDPELNNSPDKTPQYHRNQPKLQKMLNMLTQSFGISVKAAEKIVNKGHDEELNLLMGALQHQSLS